MAIIAPTLPTIGDANATEDVDVRNTLQTIVNTINGLLDKDNIADGTLTADELRAAELAALGLNSTGVVRRGKANIAAAEARVNTVYGLMPTPDVVTGLVLPTDGLIVVGYQALWQNSVASAGRAAIFIGPTQLKVAPASGGAGGAPIIQEATGNATVNIDAALATDIANNGLAGAAATANTTEVTTGQAISRGSGNNGGPIYVFAAAGTYDVSVQFKSASGSVTAKNRHLWAMAIGF